MDEPVVYVSTWHVREGRFAEYRRFHDQLWRIVKAKEPSVAAFLAFTNEDQAEIVNVHVYPDAAALDRHMQVLAQEVRLLREIGRAHV